MAGLVEVLREYWPNLLSGAWLTIQLVVIAAILGVVLAFPVALDGEELKLESEVEQAG